jgi:membrane peptidoglycan carboxypeptidase
LGGGEVYMTDMAVAYGVLANGGIKINLNPILEIKNYRGQVLEQYNNETNSPVGGRVLGADVSFIISNILADNNARTPAFGAYSDLHIPGKTVSVKTGTTDDLRDNWTIGYTPEYLVAVWVGNNDNSKMNGWVVSGVTGASPIWNSVMTYLLKDTEDIIPSKPENVVGMHICEYKNQAEENCQGRYDYLLKELKLMLCMEKSKIKKYG